MIQNGECDGTGDQIQTRAGGQDGGGTPSAGGQNGGNDANGQNGGNGNGGGNGGK